MDFKSTDTRIKLDSDQEALEFLKPLIVADANRFYECHDIDFESPYRRYNSLLSIRGHIANNHILPAVRYLFDNQKQLKSNFGIKLPKETSDIDSFLETYKGPYVNITAFNIANILHDCGIFPETPKEIFANVENMINEYRLFLIDTINGVPRPYFRDNKGSPIFGLNVLADLPIDNMDAFWVSTAWALGVMDDATYRAETCLNLGGGVNCAINLEAMMNQVGTGMSFDLKSLSDFDVVEYLNLPKDTSSVKAIEVFFERVWPKFVDMGITYDVVQKQNSSFTDGYIRIMKGNSQNREERKKYGTADSMSNMFSGFNFGISGFIGMVGGDGMDTAEGLAEDIYPGGHDSNLLKELMQHAKFRDTVAPYLTSKYTNLLIGWGSEVPPHEVSNQNFIPPSCSQRYLNEMYYKKDKEPFTTLEIELWALNNIKKIVTTGAVPKEIPQYPMAFEQVPSRFFWDNLIQKTNRYLREGLFPKESWIHSQVC